MIIDESTKTIFLHNPKCGGTFFQKSYKRCHPTYPFQLYWSLLDKETNVDLTHINIHTLPRFVPDYLDYRVLTFVRNPYNRFVSAFQTAASFDPELKIFFEQHEFNAKKVCKYLLSCDYQEQDYFLRNLKRPWFMPQSNYFDHRTTVLKYESLSDWNFILRAFNIHDAEVVIPEDKNMDDETRRMIRDLYFEDDSVFALYE